MMPVPAPLAVILPVISISPSPLISYPVILRSASIAMTKSPSVNTAPAVVLSSIPGISAPPPPVTNTPPAVVPSPEYSFLVSVTYISSPSAGVILVLFASVPRLSFKAILIVSWYLFYIFIQCTKKLFVYFKKSPCSLANICL